MRQLTNTKLSWKVGKTTIRIGFSLTREKGERIAGITNRTEDGKFIVFLDYDGMKIRWLTTELISLQHAFALSDFLVLQSSKNCYHAVCFDKLKWAEMQEVMQNATIDQRHITIPMRIGLKLVSLRLTQKMGKNIKSVGIIRSPYNHLHQKSSGHIHIFEKAFPTVQIRKECVDDQKKAVFCSYPI